MAINKNYDKISMSEAQKMIKSRDPFAHLMHIEWFTPRTGYSIIHGVDLESENPDCSHVLVDGRKRWREGSVVALVLTNKDE